MSDAEQALRSVLRGRQVSDLKFRRQHPFGDYILDFVCLENRLVIEVDGGHHGQNQGYDENGTKSCRRLGFVVLRFWNNEVLNEIESVKEKIWLALQEVQPRRPPNLPLQGEELESRPLRGRKSKLLIDSKVKRHVRQIRLLTLPASAEASSGRQALNGEATNNFPPSQGEGQGGGGVRGGRDELRERIYHGQHKRHWLGKVPERIPLV